MSETTVSAIVGIALTLIVLIILWRAWTSSGRVEKYVTNTLCNGVSPAHPGAVPSPDNPCPAIETAAKSTHSAIGWLIFLQVILPLTVFAIALVWALTTKKKPTGEE